MRSPQFLRSSTINRQIPHAETHPVHTLPPNSHPTISDSRTNAVSTASKQRLSPPRHASPKPLEVKTIHTHEERPIRPLPSRAKKDESSSSSSLISHGNSDTVTTTALPKLTIRLPTSIPTTSTPNPSPLAPLSVPTINITQPDSDLHKGQQGQDEGESEVELVADVHPSLHTIDDGRKRKGVATGTRESDDDDDDAYVPPARKRKVVIVVPPKPSPEVRCSECIKEEEPYCEHRCGICQQKGIECVPPPVESRWTICVGCRGNTAKKACSLQLHFKAQKLQKKALSAQAASNEAVKLSTQACQQKNATRQQPSRPQKGKASYADPNSDDDEQDQIKSEVQVKKEWVGKRNVDVGDALAQPKTKRARVNPTTSATPLPVMYHLETMAKVAPLHDPLPPSIAAKTSSSEPTSVENTTASPANPGQPSALPPTARLIRPASGEKIDPPPTNPGQPSALPPMAKLTRPAWAEKVDPPPANPGQPPALPSAEKFVPPLGNAGKPSALTKPPMAQLTRPASAEKLPPARPIRIFEPLVDQLTPGSSKPPANAPPLNGTRLPPRSTDPPVARPPIPSQTPHTSSQSPDHDCPFTNELALAEPLLVDMLAHTGARVTEHLMGSVQERCESLIDEISEECLKILQPQIDRIAAAAVRNLQPTLASMSVRPYQTRSSSRSNSNVPSARSSSSPTPFVASAVQSEIHRKFTGFISLFPSFNSSA